MTIKTVMLTWGDSISDYYAAVLLVRARSKYTNPMVIMLAIANVIQALSAYFWQKEGGFVTLAALLGLKPLVDGHRIVFDIESEGEFELLALAAQRIERAEAEANYPLGWTVEE